MPKIDPWRQFRRTTRIGVMALLVIPLSAVLGILAARQPATDALIRPLFVAAGASLAIALLATGYQSLLRCPRCGHLFFRKKWNSYYLLRRSCASCTLKLYDGA
jgi:hypothetical protein